VCLARLSRRVGVCLARLSRRVGVSSRMLLSIAFRMNVRYIFVGFEFESHVYVGFEFESHV